MTAAYDPQNRRVPEADTRAAPTRGYADTRESRRGAALAGRTPTSPAYARPLRGSREPTSVPPCCAYCGAPPGRIHALDCQHYPDIVPQDARFAASARDDASDAKVRAARHGFVRVYRETQRPRQWLGRCTCGNGIRCNSEAEAWAFFKRKGCADA